MPPPAALATVPYKPSRNSLTLTAPCPRPACLHTADFEKGFIRAETVAYDDFVAAGGFGAAKEKGLLRLEGKEYVVKEGDILMFRFAT